MKLDVGKFAAAVIGSSGGAVVKPAFRLDTTKYFWIKDYLRDKKLRAEIKQLQDDIAAINVYPIAKDELRKMFEARIKQINKFRLEQLITHLGEVQKRETSLLNENSINERRFNGALFDPTLINLTSNDIDHIFSQLQEGVVHELIEKNVRELQEEIVKLGKIIEDELSPRERWLHRDNGLPSPYPQGCRWTPFVETWQLVAAKFNDKVDVEGCRLKTPEQFAAYDLLGLDRVRKKPPLREPL